MKFLIATWGVSQFMISFQTHLASIRCITIVLEIKIYFHSPEPSESIQSTLELRSLNQRSRYSIDSSLFTITYTSRAVLTSTTSITCIKSKRSSNNLPNATNNAPRITTYHAKVSTFQTSPNSRNSILPNLKTHEDLSPSSQSLLRGESK